MEGLQVLKDWSCLRNPMPNSGHLLHPELPLNMWPVTVWLPTSPEDSYNRSSVVC